MYVTHLYTYILNMYLCVFTCVSIKERKELPGYSNNLQHQMPEAGKVFGWWQGFEGNYHYIHFYA